MGAMWSSLGQVAASLVELQLRALQAGPAGQTWAGGRDERAAPLSASDREDSFVSASGLPEATSKDESARPTAAARCGQGECARNGASSRAAGARTSRRAGRRNPISSEFERESGDKRRANEMQATIVFVAQAEPLAHVTPSAASLLLYQDSNHSCELFCDHYEHEHKAEPISERGRELASPGKQAERQSRARGEPNFQAPPSPVGRNHRINLTRSKRLQVNGEIDCERDNGRCKGNKLTPAMESSEAVERDPDHQAGRAQDSPASGGDESAALALDDGQRESVTLFGSSSFSFAAKTQSRQRLIQSPPGLTATNAPTTQAAKTIRRANNGRHQAELIHSDEQEPKRPQQQQQQRSQLQQQQQLDNHSAAPTSHLFGANQNERPTRTWMPAAVVNLQSLPAPRRHQPSERPNSTGCGASATHAAGNFYSPPQYSRRRSLSRLHAHSSQPTTDQPNKTIQLSANHNTTTNTPTPAPKPTAPQPEPEMTILQNHNQTSNRLAAAVSSEQAASLTANKSKFQHRRFFYGTHQSPHDYLGHQQQQQQQQLPKQQQDTLSKVLAGRAKSASYPNPSASRLVNKCARLSNFTNYHLEAPNFSSAVVGLQRKSSDQPIGSLDPNRYLQAASNQIKRKLSADYSLGHVQTRDPLNSNIQHQTTLLNYPNHQQQQQHNNHSPVITTASNMKQNSRDKQMSPTLPSQTLHSAANTTREHRSLSTCSTMTTSSTHSLGHSSTSSGFSSPVINDELNQSAATSRSTAGKSRRLLRRQNQLMAAVDCRSSSCSLSSSSSVNSTASSISSLGDESTAANTSSDILHPTVSALLLSSANLQRQRNQVERNKPKRSRHHQATPVAAGKPIKLLDSNVPKFAREPRIQDSTYFESPAALDKAQTIQLQLAENKGPGTEPPPRPWLEPNNPLAKRSSLAGPIDGRTRSLLALNKALGRHHSLGEVQFFNHQASGMSRQSLSASSTTSSNREQLQHPVADPIAAHEFTALSYNVLSDRLVNTERFPSSPDIALNWLYRRELILRQLGEYDPDLIALQELEMEQFCDYFEPQLRQPARNYVGLFESKSRARTMDPQMRKRVDGCAIFYKSSRFRLLGQHLLEFNRLALANSRGSEAMINRVSTRDNIAMVAVLELIEPQPCHEQQAQVEMGGDSTTPLLQDNQAAKSSKRLIVCNTHIHWDPEFCDVKLVQTIMLMNELKNIAANYAHTQTSAELPLVLLGDFNSLPKSAVTSYLLSGYISSLHADFRSFRYTQCDNSLVKTAEQRQQENQDIRPAEIQAERRPALMRTASSRTDVKPAQLASQLLVHRRDSLPLSSSNTINSITVSGPPSGSLISHTLTSYNSPSGYHSSCSISASKGASNPESPAIIDYAHPFKLKSAYELGTMPFTNYTTKFKATIDYIFYSQDSLSLLGLLGPLDKRWLRGHKIRGFPQLHFPSDHLPLLVKFKLISAAPVDQQASATVAEAPAAGASNNNNNHPARKQSLVVESLTLKQNIKKSNKKQKYAPRRDRLNEFAAFNHKKPDHQHSIQGLGSSTPGQHQNQQTLSLGSGPRSHKQQQQQRPFWPKKLAAATAGQQPDKLSERIKVSERWS